MVKARGEDQSAARPYHHGNLRQALIEAALALAQQNGPERVSVREAARHLGVSPAAPFRHFPNRRALMTAVAEEAGERLLIEVRKALAREKGDALARLRAVGRGYLKWAQRHPAHFRIISARDQIDIEGSTALRHNIQAVRELTEQALRAAQDSGQISTRHEAPALALLARATVYGLVRMQLDGHFGQWEITPAAAPAAMEATLDLLIALLQEPSRP
jgi:AcrR family transcriptional regulator